MPDVTIEKRKPCGRVRRRWSATPLGPDVWGDWFAVPETGGVLLMPVADPWVAWFRPDGFVRVDVATAVVVAAPVCSFVDLDLDVERDPDGLVRVLDLDDFLARSPGYPPEWTRLAWEAWGEVEHDVTARVEPFADAAAPWLRQIARPIAHPAATRPTSELVAA